MKLSLEGSYAQLYDVNYKGTVYSAASFLCLIISDEKFKPDPIQDEFLQFQARLRGKILPALLKMINKSLSANPLKTQYVIHDLGGEQGQIHPHILMRRADFRQLGPRDKMNINHLITKAIEQINSKPVMQVRFDLVNTVFHPHPQELPIEDEKPIGAHLNS